MRFSCAPSERAGHTNKGNQLVATTASEFSGITEQRPPMRSIQRQLQTLVRPQAARSIQFRSRSQKPTALRKPPDRRIPTAAEYGRLAFSMLKRSPREAVTEHAGQDSERDLSKDYSLRAGQSTGRSHTCDKRLRPNGYAFQLRPTGARGSHEQRQSTRGLHDHVTFYRHGARAVARVGRSASCKRWLGSPPEAYRNLSSDFCL